LRLLRGACPEHLEILRYLFASLRASAQNDRRRRAHNSHLPSLRGIPNEVRDDEAIWYPTEIATPSARNDNRKGRNDSRKGSE